MTARDWNTDEGDIPALTILTDFWRWSFKLGRGDVKMGTDGDG
jgi:hypothetical protein